MAASQRSRPGLPLFWRTFFLLALLLLGSILAWLQTFRALEIEPRAIQTAQQIASLVNFSRAALTHSDPISRLALLKVLDETEGVRVQLREPQDEYTPLPSGMTEEIIAAQLLIRLGPGSALASSVRGEPGLWVGFTIDSDRYWMRLDRERLAWVGGRTWLIWLVTAAALSLAGAALIARLINKPLKELSYAASRVREGDYGGSRLDEEAVTSEIREVNIGFNRMAHQLAKIEQDRAVMLAGISHDLRTPLARLRLEAEMSVTEPEARAHIAADIDQLDAIIDKFLDYARPDHGKLRTLRLRELVQNCAQALRTQEEMHVRIHVPADLMVLADSVELSRVLANLLENARRYGRTRATGVAEVDIEAQARGDTVLLKVRDHGRGVPPEMLANLTKPFFRGDSARTAATGAGLGLAIVDKMVQHMGGSLTLINEATGGLSALIQLQRPRPSGLDIGQRARSIERTL